GRGAVAGREGEAVRAVVVGGRRVGGDVAGHRHRAVGAVGGAVGQGVAVHVAGAQRDAAGGVFIGGERAVDRHRGVVDGVHRDGDGRRVRGRGAVAGREGEAVRAVVVGGRRVGGDVAGHRHRAVGAVGGAVGQGVAVHVAGAQRDAAGGVFIGGERAVDRHRGVVDGVHRDGDGRRVRGRGAVAGREGEAVRAVVVGGRRVGGDVAAHRHRAVSAVGGAVGQGVAVHVAGAQRDAAGGVFIGGERAVDRHRGVVDGVHRDGDGRRVRGRGAVAGREGEAVRAVVVGGRRVGGDVAGHRHRAVGAVGGAVGQGVAVHVAGAQRDAAGGVFIGGERAVDRHRGVVDGVH